MATAARGASGLDLALHGKQDQHDSGEAASGPSSVPALAARGTALVTGGGGNLACQLAWKLAERFSRLVLFDRAEQPAAAVPRGCAYVRGDLTDGDHLSALMLEHRPRVVVHLASLLSGSCEQDRLRGWQVNADGGFALLEASLAAGVKTVLFPSSLAAYGGEPADPLPEDAPQWPDGLYGVTKLAVERLGVYYQRKHGLDFRSLRLPIVVSRFAPPGAASAYASHAFVEAIARGQFTFRVQPDTRASVVYVHDALEALVRLLDAPVERLTRRVYNIQAICPSAQEIVDCIHERLPHAQLLFEPDAAVDALISSWPRRLVDASARQDWGWQPSFDLPRLADHFIKELRLEFPHAPGL